METTLENATIIAVVGFATVLVCLVGFAIIISFVNKLNSLMVSYKQGRAQLSEVSSPIAATSAHGISDIDVAVITAAITATIGERVRIRKISFLAPASENTAWAQMSKAQKFEDHKIIQKRRVNYEK